jgi:hypothetical protein
VLRQCDDRSDECVSGGSEIDSYDRKHVPVWILTAANCYSVGSEVVVERIDE